MSFAFIDTLSGEVSLHLAAETSKEQVLRDYPDQRLSAVRAAFLRGLGYLLVRDPESGDHSHVLMCPQAGTRSKSQKNARKIALQAEWVP